MSVLQKKITTKTRTALVSAFEAMQAADKAGDEAKLRSAVQSAKSALDAVSASLTPSTATGTEKGYTRPGAVDDAIRRVGKVSPVESEMDLTMLSFEAFPNDAPDLAIGKYLATEDGQRLRRMMNTAKGSDARHHPAPVTESDLHKVASESRETRLLQLAKDRGCSVAEANRILREQELAS